MRWGRPGVRDHERRAARRLAQQLQPALAGFDNTAVHSGHARVCPLRENNPSEARLCWSCGTLLPAGPAGGEERRVVTVLFVDLVDFTGISTRLDPEDLEARPGAVLPPGADGARALRRARREVHRRRGDGPVRGSGRLRRRRAARRAGGVRDPPRDRRAERRGGPRPEVRVAVNTGEAFVDLSARADAGEEWRRATSSSPRSGSSRRPRSVRSSSARRPTVRRSVRSSTPSSRRWPPRASPSRCPHGERSPSTSRQAVRRPGSSAGTTSSRSYVRSWGRTISAPRSWSRSSAARESASRASSGSCAGRWKTTPKRSSGGRGDASATAAGSASRRSPSW